MTEDMCRQCTRLSRLHRYGPLDALPHAPVPGCGHASSGRIAKQQRARQAMYVLPQIVRQKARHGHATHAIFGLCTLALRIITIKANGPFNSQIRAFKVNVKNSQGQSFFPAESTAVDDPQKCFIHILKIGGKDRFLFPVC